MKHFHPFTNTVSGYLSHQRKSKLWWLHDSMDFMVLHSVKHTLANIYGFDLTKLIREVVDGRTNCHETSSSKLNKTGTRFI